ncbi:MAG: hypothetical protein JW741_25450 [Sedimentisphaerales bacterium]|nr:hypothetical protein [Sedimentisphaerales bacterium]
MNRHSQIADAVTAAINAAALGAFVAVRKARPNATREELEFGVVQVVPSTFTCQAADRARTTAYYGVDVGVQQAIDPDNVPAFDALLDLIHAIRGLFGLKRLPGCEVAAWQATETVPGAEAGYSPEHLDNKRVFTGVLRFTFMVTE